jgi:metal-responsive CopG/Arc/MetJ family transcriptional regulator
MSRTSKIVAFSVPPAMVKEVETLAKEECSTKSELFREMVRVFRRYRAQRDRDEERWILNVIAEAKAEQAKNPKSMEELLAEDERLVRYGQQQAKKLGIKPKDVSRLIHEYRQDEYRRKRRP